MGREISTVPGFFINSILQKEKFTLEFSGYVTAYTGTLITIVSGILFLSYKTLSEFFYKLLEVISFLCFIINVRILKSNDFTIKPTALKDSTTNFLTNNKNIHLKKLNFISHLYMLMA